MPEGEILFEQDGPIAIITLNRPEVMNALSPEMDDELERTLRKADADSSVRVIVLTGAGTAFSAGYDLGNSSRVASMDSRQESEDNFRSGGAGAVIAHWQRLDADKNDKLMLLWRLTKPVIAAVNGWAMGGGFFYQLAADITIASERAVFAQPEVRHISNTTILFPLLCGWKAANRYAWTGDHIDAQEAFRIGMVNEVVPHDELIPRCKELGRRLALVPEASIRLNKAIAMQGLQASGVLSSVLLNSALSSMAHSSDGPDRARLFDALREGGVRAYLDARDGPFQPEPFGPKSKKR